MTLQSLHAHASFSKESYVKQVSGCGEHSTNIGDKFLIGSLQIICSVLEEHYYSEGQGSFSLIIPNNVCRSLLRHAQSPSKPQTYALYFNLLL